MTEQTDPERSAKEEHDFRKTLTTMNKEHINSFCNSDIDECERYEVGDTNADVAWEIHALRHKLDTTNIALNGLIQAVHQIASELQKLREEQPKK